MRIVFWGCERKSCVTSNMIILAGYLACQRGYRIAMLEWAEEKCGLQTYFPKSHKKYQKNFIETIVERQLYYVSKAAEQEFSSETEMLRYLEGNMDMVFLNLANRTDGAAKHMMHNADLVVVNLKQEFRTFDLFYAQYANLCARILLLIGNYIEDGACDKAHLQEKYKIPESQLAVIPNNPEYQMACAYGRLDRYIRRSKHCYMTAIKEQFLKEVGKTAEQLVCASYSTKKR